jgi:hypothetical protein
MSKGKRFKAEQIVHKLREADGPIGVAAGHTSGCRGAGSQQR